MAGGPILPASIYFGGASGLASPLPYIPATNTNTAGAFEGIQVAASLSADAPIPMQFILPEILPTGLMKLRLLAMANATSGNAKITVASGVTAAGSNVGTTTLTTDASAQTVTWTTADVMVETKINSGATPVANSILTILLTFNTSSWTLAQTSVWVPSVVWE